MRMISIPRWDIPLTFSLSFCVRSRLAARQRINRIPSSRDYCAFLLFSSLSTARDFETVPSFLPLQHQLFVTKQVKIQRHLVGRFPHYYLTPFSHSNDYFEIPKDLCYSCVLLVTSMRSVKMSSRTGHIGCHKTFRQVDKRYKSSAQFSEFCRILLSPLNRPTFNRFEMYHQSATYGIRLSCPHIGTVGKAACRWTTINHSYRSPSKRLFHPRRIRQYKRFVWNRWLLKRSMRRQPWVIDEDAWDLAEMVNGRPCVCDLVSPATDVCAQLTHSCRILITLALHTDFEIA